MTHLIVSLHRVANNLGVRSAIFISGRKVSALIHKAAHYLNVVASLGLLAPRGKLVPLDGWVLLEAVDGELELQLASLIGLGYLTKELIIGQRIPPEPAVAV